MTTAEDKQKEKEQGQIREQRIKEIENSVPLSEIKNHYKVPYRGKLLELPVYQIPLKWNMQIPYLYSCYRRVVSLDADPNPKISRV